MLLIENVCIQAEACWSEATAKPHALKTYQRKTMVNFLRVVK